MVDRKIAIIGIGNAGGQIAYLAKKTCGDLIDSVYINSSDADLAMIGDAEFKFKIGEGELEGSGKNRTRMKRYLKEDIGSIVGNVGLQQLINEKKYVFIVSSAAGGTGSGAAPVLFSILRDIFIDVHFILVTVLPQLQASLMEQGNAREYCDELYRNIPDCTYMVYDNETRSDMSPTQTLVSVNEAIVADIRVLSGIDNYPTPYESIDEADMEAIITTPGRLVVSRIHRGITEKVMEDTSIDDLIISSIKRSCHAETNRDKKIIRCGIITYFTEPVNRLYGSGLEKLTDFIGTPIERFNHNAVNENSETMNFLYWIGAGLSPINDRIQKMDNRAEELKEALARSNAGDYVSSGETTSYDVMQERSKRKRHEDRLNKPVEVESYFDKF